MTSKHTREAGAISGSLVAIVALIFLFIIAGSLAIWAYLQYNEARTNVDGKVDVAIAEAKKEQADADERKFSQREKEPNRQFVGPDDYGRVTFDYPKTWSVYEAKDVSKNGGVYEAYLNPVKVPPVSATQQFALRVIIEQEDYAEILKTYQSKIKDGKLRSSSFSANGNDGTRIDGSFTDEIRGSAVVFKIRDKTLTVRTDANTFKPDFDTLIKTLNFNT